MLTTDAYIVVDDEIMGGTPVIRGTRVTVYAVLGRIVRHSFVKRERFLSSLCMRSILSVRHFDIPFPATWTALGR